MLPIDEPDLNTYFAVEVLPREHPHDTAGAICKAGKDTKVFFRRLEALDTIAMAGKTFLRCRSDVTNFQPMFDHLFGQSRAYVTANGGKYTAKFQNGRIGQVSGVTMHVTPKGGFRTTLYKGPMVKYWERQFMEDS